MMGIVVAANLQRKINQAQDAEDRCLRAAEVAERHGDKTAAQGCRDEALKHAREVNRLVALATL